MSAPLFVLCLALCLSTGFSMESLKADDGYEVFPAYPWSRYKVPPLIRTWTDAFFFCANDGEGSHLVVIDSDAEAVVVGELVRRTPYAPWVGISDTATEGQWVTVLGDLVSESGYDNWQAGFPNGGKDRNCGLVNNDIRYSDFLCTYAQPFICEKPNV